MGMYRYLITDFLNPVALLAQGPGSPRSMLNEEAMFGLMMILMVQLYFSWRVWVLTQTIRQSVRVVFVMLPVALSFMSLGSNIAIVVLGFQENTASPSPTWTANWFLVWKLAMASEIACDTMISVTMVWTLYKSRTGVKTTDNVISTLILFTVNTFSLTAVISIATLVTFLVFPSNLIYAALQDMAPKVYLNAALASINARDYVRDQLYPDMPVTVSTAKFGFPTTQDSSLNTFSTPNQGKESYHEPTVFSENRSLRRMPKTEGI